MSRYRGPRLKIVRRLKVPIPGLTQKSTERLYPPGEHGAKYKRTSDYLIRLQEKQKLKYNYGLTEHQLYQYIKKAKKVRGATGALIIKFLEMRLDTIVFRGGLAPTIPSARQIISHCHILVNKKKVNIPSFNCKKGDLIEIVPKAKKHVLEIQKQKNYTTSIPSHLKLLNEDLSIKILQSAKPQDSCIKVNELLVIEYYSRR